MRRQFLTAVILNRDAESFPLRGKRSNGFPLRGRPACPSAPRPTTSIGRSLSLPPAAGCGQKQKPPLWSLPLQRPCQNRHYSRHARHRRFWHGRCCAPLPSRRTCFCCFCFPLEDRRPVEDMKRRSSGGKHVLGALDNSWRVAEAAGHTNKEENDEYIRQRKTKRTNRRAGIHW